MDTKYTYWARSSVGLEKILLKELQDQFLIAAYAIKHKSVFFTLETPVTNDIHFANSLNSADDLYVFAGSCNGIDNTKSSIDAIIFHFKKVVLPYLLNYPSGFCRITVSFLGTRNYNRFYIENVLNKIIVLETHCNILSNEKEEKWKKGEKRIRIHIEDDTAYFGIGILDRPLHRRLWRLNSYPAQLHPPLAAAMALSSFPQKDVYIIDPFCGSGTILIESALRNPDRKHIGFDISESAIKITKENAALANVSIDVVLEDFIKKYESIGDYFILSNPPWGEKHLIDPDRKDTFYQNIIKIVAKSKGAVLLIPEELIVNLKNRGLEVQELFQTRIRGKLASVISIS